MRKLLLSAAAVFLCQVAGSALAVTSSGIVQGDFSNVDYGSNSATAPATTFITNSSSGSTLQWGTGSVAYGTPYSTIEFIGATVPLQDVTHPVLLGTIVYLNGTSNSDSIISGATLTFSVGGITLGSDQLIITSTTNLYANNLDLTLAQAQSDADYANICGSGSNICATGLQAFEDTEGIGGVAFSDPLVVNLYGTYSIDPSVNLTGAEYVSGDGVVGDRLAAAAPEASTWAMVALGFAGIIFTARAGSRNAIAQVA